jgi:HAD superfamily hydrolase (TIGR01490 family)
MKSPNRIAIFDIDGTIFRSSLLIELVEALINNKLFPAKAKNIYAAAYKDWSNRQGSYEDYINAVVTAFMKHIKGVSHEAYLKIAKQVVSDNKDRVYRYTRDLIKDLKNKNYYLLAISSSPKEIVQSFCHELGFDKVYGREYEVINKVFTGQMLHVDLISDKAKMLSHFLETEKFTLVDSIGVGDSEGDISLLKMVEYPICFNPNSKLYVKAKKFGWKIVVERKDVIYEKI